MKKVLFLLLASSLVLSACENQEESKSDDKKETKSSDKKSEKIINRERIKKFLTKTMKTQVINLMILTKQKKQTMWQLNKQQAKMNHKIEH